MRLKTLRVKGFKSFADDTVLNFNEQVIGVVGPNGSGKSNIVDAIRWVLGEQKGKELRLQSMGDVLFNGTKKRKGAKLAQVTIEFENDKGILPSEFKTVSISRLLYKSGESEYRLNDTKCRLKDITNLFVDTGIGSNSYAIIELGMVDDILSDKDRARRRMFEQAAGVSKYKKRKRETLLKLKSTSEDLERVEDLLFEIENNLKMLEKQAKRARKHVRLKEQYKDLSIQLALIQTKVHKEEYNRIKEIIAQTQIELSSQESSLAKAEAALEERKRTTLNNEQEVSEAQRKLNVLTEEVRKLEAEKSMLKQRADFIKQNSKRLEQSLANLAEQTEELNGKLQGFDQSITDAQIQEKEAKVEMEKAKSALEHRTAQFESAQTALDARLAEKQKLDTLKYEIEKQQAIHTNRIDTLRMNIEKLQVEVEKKSNRLDELSRVSKASKKEVNRLEQLIKKLETEEEQRKEKEASLRERIVQLSETISQVGREIDARRHEYNLLKSMVDQLEGFPESIKYLSKNWSIPAPLLTDVIDVPERYRMAVEQYLEPYLNTYIVDNVRQAVEAVHLLSGAQKGTARFFILSELPVVPEPKAQIGWTRALDLIDTEVRYKPLFNLLLNGVFFVEEEPVDVLLEDERIVLIQPDHGMIRARFNLTGGSVGLFSGKKIGRKKQLEKLEKELKKFKNKAETLEGKLSKAKEELKALQNVQDPDKLKALRTDFSEESRKSIQYSTQLDHLEKEIQRNAIQIDEFTERTNQLISEEASRVVDLAEVKKKISILDKEIRSQGGEVQTWNEQLSQVSALFNERNIIYFKEKNKLEYLSKERKYFEERIEALKHSEKDQKSQREKNKLELDKVERRLSELEIELTDKYQEKRSGQTLLRDRESKFYEVRNAITAQEQEVKELRSHVHKLQISLSEYKEQYNSLRLQLTSIGERINIEFGLSIDYLMKTDVETEMEVEELMDKVEKLKRRLDNFGEVNPLAMHAFDEMKSRYDTIVSQRQDILDAKDSLETTIDEIEKKATLLFLEAFGQVKEYFRSVFRSLFTEDDDCDLILLDPEHPLNSDIEIVAKPKGKRPKTLSQLSGGEKTLTAIALLFSLYLLKPAPFCIFDEVDAPLDDANILKFNNIISEFSKYSQFIIVTHNKLTMAEVDILYGVFMQENGVSAVSEVDFRKLSHTALIENV